MSRSYLECVHSVSVHMAVVGRDTPVVQPPKEHVGALGDVGQVVHDAPPLLYVRLRVGLHGMNNIWKLHPNDRIMSIAVTYKELANERKSVDLP